MSPVGFTEDGARRIVAATKAYEAGSRDMPPVRFRDPGGDDGGGAAIRLGKTDPFGGVWAKGTSYRVQTYLLAPPNEGTGGGFNVVEAFNRFADVGEGKWVMIAKTETGFWYLISAEC